MSKRENCTVAVPAIHPRGLELALKSAGLATISFGHVQHVRTMWVSESRSKLERLGQQVVSLSAATAVKACFEAGHVRCLPCWLWQAMWWCDTMLRYLSEIGHVA